MKKLEVCAICKKEIIRVKNSISTGYGTNDKGEKICYACIGEMDKKELIETGKFNGYLSKDENGYYFGNWPSSLKIRVNCFRQSWHNMAALISGLPLKISDFTEYKLDLIAKLQQSKK